MKLLEIFNHLTSGEFAQLHIGGAEEGEITEANYAKVVSHINLGLGNLYQRFFLKEGRVDLNMVAGKSIYPIHSTYLSTNAASNQPVKYLQNNEFGTFADDIYKVEAVQTDAGLDLPFNDVLDPYSVFTPSPTVLRIPAALVSQEAGIPDAYKTSKLTIVYRAKHPHINIDAASFSPELLELELPESHLEALLLFVASRAHTPLGMVNEFNSGNNYASKYELACQALEKNAFYIDTSTSNHRLIKNGWV